MKNSIVLIGGGHGLSNLVKGFKNEDIELNVIVASTDDGGHTGKIREEFNCIAVGDLRMVLSELISKQSVFQDVFDYRFNCLHGEKSVSLGNLVVLSLMKKYQDINKVLQIIKQKEGYSANVFLSSDSPVTLCAECEGNEIVKCERLIGCCGKKINRLFVEGNAICNEDMLKKIRDAGTIVLAPGSLYTSIGAVLCIDKIKEAILESGARVVYVCNIMSQYGETEGFKVEDHVKALEGMLGKSIERVIVNKGTIDEKILKKYREENSDIVEWEDKERYEFYDLVEIREGKIRHNSELVKKIILYQQ